MFETLSIAFFLVEHISSIWSNRLKITKRRRKQSPRSVETLETRNFSHTGRMQFEKDYGRWLLGFSSARRTRPKPRLREKNCCARWKLKDLGDELRDAGIEYSG